MAFVLVNPHNPTGRVFTRQELESLVEICLRYDVKIVSDEVHSLVVYDGLHHIPALAVSEAPGPSRSRSSVPPRALT